jgi:hypothetical protein
MIHKVSEERLKFINDMDTKIGEFMQKRADVVNRIIYEVATFQSGDMVKVYDKEKYICSGFIVQPLFLKKQGIISYRVRKEDGEVFINEKYTLVKM